MSKRRTRVYRAIIIIPSILITGGLFFYRLYYEPHKYKSDYFEGLKKSEYYSQFPDSTLLTYIDCVYDKLIDEYGSIKNFPENSGVSDFEYFRILTYCEACNFYEDSMKNFILNNIDSLVLETIKYQNQKLE